MSDSESKTPPRYCQASEHCYREPTILSGWMEESEGGSLVENWVCEACFEAMNYGCIEIPTHNLQKMEEL